MWTDDFEGSIAEHTALPPHIFPSVCLVTLSLSLLQLQQYIHIAYDNSSTGSVSKMKNCLDPLTDCSLSSSRDLSIPQAHCSPIIFRRANI